MPDYTIVQGPSGASYTAPNISQLLYQGLSNIPTAYYQGQEEQYRQRLREPASTDPETLKKQMAQRGGVAMMKDLLPFMLLQQTGGATAQTLADLDRQVNGGVRSAPTAPAAPPAAPTAPPVLPGVAPTAPAATPTAPSAPPNPAGAGPANISPRAGMAYPREGTEGTSLTIMGTELAGGRDVSPAINRVARIMGVDPAAELPPAAVNMARTLLNRAIGGAVPPPAPDISGRGVRFIRPGVIEVMPRNPPVPSGTAEVGESPITTPGGRSEFEAPSGPTSAVERGLTPLRGPAGASGAPAPVTAAPGTAVPLATGRSETPISGPPGPVEAIQRAQRDPLIQRLLSGAARAREIAAAEAIRNPAASKAALDQASAYEQRARIMLEAASRAAEPTGPMKESAALGMTPLQFERVKAQQAEDIKTFGKLNTGMQAMANTGVAMLPTLHAARSLIDAGAATGWGSDKILAAKQMLARIGGDPSGAMKLEAFGKQMAAFINQQSNTLRGEAIEMGGNSVRIFASQMENMQKASPSPDYTPAGNRYLIEVYKRGIDRAVFLANAANKYGPLDRNFETWARQWQIDHPMFSEAELRDPRRVAPPVARTPDDLRAMGWHEGEPFLTPDGRILTHMPTR
jgi:hypothetical protein